MREDSAARIVNGKEEGVGGKPSAVGVKENREESRELRCSVVDRAAGKEGSSPIEECLALTRGGDRGRGPGSVRREGYDSADGAGNVVS